MEANAEMQEIIKKYVEDHHDDIIEFWKMLVNTPSQARIEADARNMHNVLKGVYEEMGFEMQTIEVGGTSAPALEGIWGKDLPGAPVLFSGHFDTVSLPGDHPFVIDEEGKAHGLGCLDMKGGITVATFAIRALQEAGWKERPIKVLWLGDEEKGHQGAKTPEVIMEQAKGALCAFNMETGLVSNAICVGRKGGGVASYTVHGISGHAGNEFAKCRNAIYETAHKMVDLEALIDVDKGTTVSATLISSTNKVPNAIPGDCSIDVDVRYELTDERNRVVDAFKVIAEKAYIDGCTTEYNYAEYMAPFETTDEGVRLATFISDVSEAIGLKAMDQVRLGGGSDASYITMAGVPSVCSMGVRGEFNHTEKEYAYVDSVFDRTVLMANVVANIAGFEK